ncbi:MAG: aminoglycoside phosphotransferase family protein [Candidatus Binatia bacterium]
MLASPFPGGGAQPRFGVSRGAVSGLLTTLGGVATGAAVEAALASLLAELVRESFGARARVRRAAPLAGDASTRRYARVWLEGPNVPASAVAMILADRGVTLSSDELAVLEQPVAELPYLNVHRFLVALGVAVPRLYADASERGVLLLEDVGDTALWDAVAQRVGGAEPACVTALFERAIEQLLLIQVQGTRRFDRHCIAFQQAFDERLFMWEFEHFIEYGLERRVGRSLPAAEAAILRSHFTAIARVLAAQPRYLSHRDFHSWNLFVQGGAIRVLDFQDALLAPAPYDLATLLGDRDTPRVIRPPTEAALLDYYRRRWRELSGLDLGAGALGEVYFLCALQKALKVVGRFYFLDCEKGKPGYLRYIPSTLRQIERLLPRFPEHAEMANILRSYLPEVDPCGP